MKRHFIIDVNFCIKQNKKCKINSILVYIIYSFRKWIVFIEQGKLSHSCVWFTFFVELCLCLFALSNVKLFFLKVRNGSWKWSGRWNKNSSVCFHFICKANFDQFKNKHNRERERFNFCTIKKFMWITVRDSCLSISYLIDLSLRSLISLIDSRFDTCFLRKGDRIRINEVKQTILLIVLSSIDSHGAFHCLFMRLKIKTTWKWLNLNTSITSTKNIRLLFFRF